jgi:hypothetical protein
MEIENLYFYFFIFFILSHWFISSNRLQMKQQSIQLDNKVKNRGKIYRHPGAKDGLKSKSPYEGIPESTTLYESFMTSVEKCGDNNCLGTRNNDGPYEWKTYKQVEKLGTQFGSGLVKLGLKPQSMFGIFAQNSEKWVIADRGSVLYNMTTVPLYEVKLHFF